MNIRMTDTPSAKRVIIDNADLHTLVNICRAAGDRFKSHAEEFDKLAQTPTPPEGALYPTGRAALLLADQFRDQALEAFQLANLFEAAESDVTFEADPEMLEDAA